MEMRSKVKFRMDRKTIQSSGEAAYDIIAGKILSGELPPGEKLSIRSMAQLTGVSMIPVIEALHRLEHEGLVESFPRWGSRVVEFSPETIRDRNALREAVECQVIRILAEMDLSSEQRTRLQHLAEELDGLPRTDEPGNPFWEKHYDFHMLLADFSGCVSLGKALHNVNLFHLLVRNTLANKEKFRIIPRGLHVKLVKEILDKKPDEAERAMREHIRLSRNGVPAEMDEKGAIL